MTARIEYSGYIRPMAEAVLTGADVDGKCSVRVPLNSYLAAVYRDPEEIDQQIATLQAARVLLVNHQADVEAAQRARGAA